MPIAKRTGNVPTVPVVGMEKLVAGESPSDAVGKLREMGGEVFLRNEPSRSARDAEHRRARRELLSSWLPLASIPRVDEDFMTGLCQVGSQLSDVDALPADVRLADSAERIMAMLRTATGREETEMFREMLLVAIDPQPPIGFLEGEGAGRFATLRKQVLADLRAKEKL